MTKNYKSKQPGIPYFLTPVRSSLLDSTVEITSDNHDKKL